MEQKTKIVALSSTLTFDHETAISLADRFIDENNFCLLESASSGPGHVARYSFLGFDPLWTWSCSGDQVTEIYDGQELNRQLSGRDPIRSFQERFSQFSFSKDSFADQKSARVADLSDLGGAIGFIGYDCSRYLEPSVGAGPPKVFGLPDLYFFIPKNFLVLDQLTKRLHCMRYFCLADHLDDQKIIEEEQRHLSLLVKRLSAVHSPPPLAIKDAPLNIDGMDSLFEKQNFLDEVERCLEQVRAGEIFQIQIGNRLSCQTSARAFDVFRHLRILNPSPYMFFYKFGHHHLLGASPEIMVNLSEDQMVHRPIAGTRKRTWNKAKDLLMREELIRCEKERAEHVMLVDLSRNDIGRIAEPGSVQVDELMVVEEYSHVFHLVSQVSGRVDRSRISAGDVMAVSFPNGTVCGAPKIRAMQLINQIESVSREFYAGSLGIFEFNGDLKTTLLIRTIYMANGMAATQASAGIVFDSIPEQEWQETRNKMAACVTAMQLTL
jgi:anthranilate synthase component 1